MYAEVHFPNGGDKPRRRNGATVSEEVTAALIDGEQPLATRSPRVVFVLRSGGVPGVPDSCVLTFSCS